MNYSDITVIITTYKSDKKIEKCINSINKKCKVLVIENSRNNSFKPFETEDFFRDNDQTTSITHLCKSGFVSILDQDNKLSDTIGKQVLNLLEEEW